jgi:hypothetical protein
LPEQLKVRKSIPTIAMLLLRTSLATPVVEGGLLRMAHMEMR